MGESWLTLYILKQDSPCPDVSLTIVWLAIYIRTGVFPVHFSFLSHAVQNKILPYVRNKSFTLHVIKIRFVCNLCTDLGFIRWSPEVPH